MKKILILVLCVVHVALYGQNTAFTYQGRLTDNGALVDGHYDIRISIHDVLSGGSALGAVTNAPTTISNGLFTTSLDFGGSVFDGTARWLEIAVRTNGSAAAFTILQPRQKIAAAPYAIKATTVTGTIPDSQLSANIARLNAGQNFSGNVTFNNASGTFAGNGSGLTNVDAATLNGFSAGSFWKTAGNNGTTAGTHFIGTLDDQSLEMRVNSRRALRIESKGTNAANLIAGYPGNFISIAANGSTIGGGGSFGADTNAIFGSYSVIAGGTRNAIHANDSTIGGGTSHQIKTNSWGSTIGGGNFNRIDQDASGSTISGGDANAIGRFTGAAVIAGGSSSTISSNCANSVIGGGWKNRLNMNSYYSIIAGGRDNTIGTHSSVVGGGVWNTIQTGARYSVIAGGEEGYIESNASHSTIAGGQGNHISAMGGTIGGGSSNIVNGPFGAIPGGTYNKAGEKSFAAGERAIADHKGSFVWADTTGSDFRTTSDNQFLIRASGGVGIGKNDPSCALDVNGDMRLNDGKLWLRGGSDPNHGLGFFNAGSFVPGSPDGPALWGCAGGTLGSACGANRASLIWDGSQRVGIGGIPPSTPLHVKQNANGSGGGIRLERSDSSSHWEMIMWSDDDLVFRHSAGNAFFYIRDTDGSQAITSDRRLKKQVTPLTGTLEKVTQLNPVSFRYNHVADDTPKAIGFIAQEVEAVYPELVDDKNGTKAVAYSAFGPLAISAVQELSRKVDSQAEELRSNAAEISALRNANTSLETRMNELELLVKSLTEQKLSAR